jgi:hypothetical protein
VSGDVERYLSLITSEHAGAPNFVSSVAASVQPFADLCATLAAMPADFDLDDAIGAQLDIVGQWIGASRYVKTPLTGVYFSFDTPGIGWDQGVWWAPGDPIAGLIALPDDIYRLLLRAKIAANQWDGTIPGAYAAWDTLFAAQGFQIVIQDNGDMTITLGLLGANGNPTFRELFSGGYLDLRPAGVLITGYLYPSENTAFFGFDTENSSISGWDVGAWGVSVPTIWELLQTESGVILSTEDGQTLAIQ